jgi:hypothetical protein
MKFAADGTIENSKSLPALAEGIWKMSVKRGGELK